MVGQTTLLSLMVILHPAGLIGWSFDPAIEWLRAIVLVAGCCILAFILVKFAAKYRKNPTRARMNVLLGLISFLVSTSAYLLRTITVRGLDPGAGIIDDFLLDISRVFLFIATYLFVLFGIMFLLAPTNETTASNFKKGIELTFFIIYSIHFITKSSELFGATGEIITQLDKVISYVFPVFGLFCIVMIIVIAVRARRLASHTTDSTYRNGLKALAMSYLVLLLGIVAFFLNGVVPSLEDNAYFIIIPLSLLIIAFYFIYAGFVRPSGKMVTK